MCGRAAYKLTREEIVELYRLTLDQPPVNTRARNNVCPTTTIDTILEQDGKRRLERMRWGLIPSWWSKPLKEMKLAEYIEIDEALTSLGAIIHFQKHLTDSDVRQLVADATQRLQRFVHARAAAARAVVTE